MFLNKVVFSFIVFFGMNAKVFADKTLACPDGYHAVQGQSATCTFTAEFHLDAPPVPNSLGCFIAYTCTIRASLSPTNACGSDIRNPGGSCKDYIQSQTGSHKLALGPAQCTRDFINKNYKTLISCVNPNPNKVTGRAACCRMNPTNLPTGTTNTGTEVGIDACNSGAVSVAGMTVDTCAM